MMRLHPGHVLDHGRLDDDILEAWPRRIRPDPGQSFIEPGAGRSRHQDDLAAPARPGLRPGRDAARLDEEAPAGIRRLRHHRCREIVAALARQQLQHHRGAEHAGVEMAVFGGDRVLELFQNHRPHFLRHDPRQQRDNRIGLAPAAVDFLLRIEPGLVDQRPDHGEPVAAAPGLGLVAEDFREVGQLLPEDDPVAVVEELLFVPRLEDKAMLVFRGYRRDPVAQKAPRILLGSVRIEVAQHIVFRLRLKVINIAFQFWISFRHGKAVAVVEAQPPHQLAGLAAPGRPAAVIHMPRRRMGDETIRTLRVAPVIDPLPEVGIAAEVVEEARQKGAAVAVAFLFAALPGAEHAVGRLGLVGGNGDVVDAVEQLVGTGEGTCRFQVGHDRQRHGLVHRWRTRQSGDHHIAERMLIELAAEKILRFFSGDIKILLVEGLETLRTRHVFQLWLVKIGVIHDDLLSWLQAGQLEPHPAGECGAEVDHPLAVDRINPGRLDW